MALAKTFLDNPSTLEQLEGILMFDFGRKVMAGNGAVVLSEFYEKFHPVAEKYRREYMDRLRHDQDAWDEIAQRLKDIAGALKILKACSEAAQINEGRCLLTGVEYAAFICAQLEGLGKRLPTLQPLSA